ncbi:MAG: response regulator transcription factor [Saprospiraceae bacterium]|nr:response regulator transcription factor [Saprospiraceae bacterium]
MNKEGAKIRIGVVEDMLEVAQEIRHMINEEEDMVCTQVYGNAEEALVFLNKFPPDVVVCDIGLPGMNGIELIRKLSTDIPSTAICMFTVFDDNENIFESLKAGAKGYILKNASPKSFIAALRELKEGGSPMSPNIARKVIDSFSSHHHSEIKPEYNLTHRESELLELLSKGLLYKEIADKLEITTGTVKQHIHKIYEKLQVNNRTEAINKWR